MTAVGVAVLGDLQVRFGVAGDTPPVSEQGTSSESDGEEGCESESDGEQGCESESDGEQGCESESGCSDSEEEL